MEVVLESQKMVDLLLRASIRWLRDVFPKFFLKQRFFYYLHRYSRNKEMAQKVTKTSQILEKRRPACQPDCDFSKKIF